MPNPKAARHSVDPTVVVFVVGVVVASLYAARPAPNDEPVGSAPATPAARVLGWARVAGVPFAAGVGLMVVGAWLGRVRRRRRLRAPRRSGESKAIADGSAGPNEEDPVAVASALIARSARRLAWLRESPLGPEMQAGRAQLDELLERDVPALLELGPVVAMRLGAVRYAEFMGAYAGCERNAARAWSALTDGAFDEVPPSVDRAISSLAMAAKYLVGDSGDGVEPKVGASSAANRG
jgi:hypothetical protein